MKTFEIQYNDGGELGFYVVKAMNRAIARAEFRKKYGSAKVIKMGEKVTVEQQAVQELAKEGKLQFGVQKSLQLGYSDLPLFQEDNQLKLF